MKNKTPAAAAAALAEDYEKKVLLNIRVIRHKQATSIVWWIMRRKCGIIYMTLPIGGHQINVINLNW